MRFKTLILILFYFEFDLSQDFGKNLNHETEFIIKNNESLTKHKTKVKIEQLLSKYKHGNEHKK